MWLLVVLIVLIRWLHQLLSYHNQYPGNQGGREGGSRHSWGILGRVTSFSHTTSTHGLKSGRLILNICEVKVWCTG